MPMLRSTLRRLAPAACLFSKGSRGSSGPSVTARRTIFGGSGFKMVVSPVFWDEHFSLKRPETWFGIFSIVVAGAYRIKVHQKDPKKRIRVKEEKEKCKRVNDPVS